MRKKSASAVQAQAGRGFVSVDIVPIGTERLETYHLSLTAKEALSFRDRDVVVIGRRPGTQYDGPAYAKRVVLKQCDVRAVANSLARESKMGADVIAKNISQHPRVRVIRD